ncbi:POU-domain protein pdm3 [Arctopsyche grandis]|uniref:POU-domain protein pdm3 n=1 Tax=Arctopsyche grandis TaxID=121162 RepID=UPI00406D71E3
MAESGGATGGGGQGSQGAQGTQPNPGSQGSQASQGSHSSTQPKETELTNAEQESERSSAAGSPGSPGPPPRSSPGPPPVPQPQPLRGGDHDINGSMAGMFRGLQSLAGLPQLSQQMSQLAASLQGLAAQPAAPAQTLTSPLNLSVAANGGLATANGAAGAGAGAGLLQPTLPSPMPQLILASGHLVQGIQGAQLLIPTSQGIATQTILTIPVNHVNSSDQMVNLALNNGQVVSTSLANLQAMAQPHQLLNNPTANASIRNNLLNQSANAALTNALLNPSALPGLLANGGVGAQQILQAMQQQQQQQQPQPHLHAGSQHSLLQTVPQSTLTNQLQSNQHSPSSSSNWSDHSSQHHQQRHYKDRDSLGYHHSSQNSHGEPSYMGDMGRDREKASSREREREREREGMVNGINGSCGNQSVSAAAAALSSISRLAASNGELTITPARSGGSPGRTPPCKLSPASTDASDLLADSPDQPTINQTSSNVVDGINLDDIKEFAKAFKLRRLSLGLTQTQVGQALSVTEGPAYSQSAICSALASQMFAAQLSSQQQNIFEKLDITPKSAQKIKPVLERWMKEAEERYATGQGHLTDFIGMEPSKKRKRRTSFTPQALELLNAHFERNTHPSGTEITGLAHQLGYEREVIRIWFCNKRQALKNTVRMMSKGMV